MLFRMIQENIAQVILNTRQYYINIVKFKFIMKVFLYQEIIKNTVNYYRKLKLVFVPIHAILAHRN